MSDNDHVAHRNIILERRESAYTTTWEAMVKKMENPVLFSGRKKLSPGWGSLSDRQIRGIHAGQKDWLSLIFDEY